MPTRLLTVKETAARLAEHPGTTRARIRRGEIPAVRKTDSPRARWSVTEKALDAYISRRTR